MRILKLKIALAEQCRRQRRLAQINSLRNEALANAPLSTQSPRQLRRQIRERARIEVHSSPSTGSDCSGSKRSRGNNVMKNYARAMVKFSLSPLADPYLERMKGKYGIIPEYFKMTLLSYKLKVNCIKGLREILLIVDEDSQELKTFKLVFQEMCIIFMKFFSVNWIYSGKMNEKSKYLSYRGKMLRRVQSPEHFTYLESFVEKKKKRSDNNLF